MATIMRAVAVLGLLTATSALGGSWGGMASGSAANYTWAGGTDINGLFGAPVSLAGDDLFFNLDFAVDTSGVTSQYDKMSVNLTANPGKKFGLIRFVFNGSVAAFDEASSASSTSTMVIKDIPNNVTYNSLPVVGPYSTTPYTFPVSGFVMDSWSGLMAADLSLAALDATQIHLDIDQALSVLGNNAMIDIQQGSLKLEIQMIPEPGTLALLALGAVSLLRRRD